MLVASKVKMSGSEKKQTGKQNKNEMFVNTDDIFSIKRVTRKFHVLTTTAKKCTEKCAKRSKLLLLVVFC